MPILARPPAHSPSKPLPLRFPLRFALSLASAIAACSSPAASVPTIGLPATHTYSIEEVGVSRGPHLNFDHFGRLAVISGDKYVVLNDRDWIDIGEKTGISPPLLEVVPLADGSYLFGALASWGKAVYTENGKLRAISDRPPNYPAWVNSTNFSGILVTDGVALFYGTNGIVRQVLATGEQSFIQHSVATIFTLGSEIFVSSNSRGTLRLDLKTGELETIDPASAIHVSARLGDGRIVGATTDSGLLAFDGKSFIPFDLGLPQRRYLSISCLATLPDGGFAVAVDGEGLFLFSANGERKMALTTSEYRRIYDLASREPGILWLAKESSVQKLYYNDPVSIVDQRSDVIVGWPLVFRWGSETVIASNGRLYDVKAGKDGWQYTFHEVLNVPVGGVWGIAANAKHLLVGNGDGAFARTPAGFVTIPGVTDASRLFFQEEDLCIVIGVEEIAALRWDGSAWQLYATTIQGVGFPSIVHEAGDSIWIELGLDYVARIWFEDGQLRKRIFDKFPWDEPVWVNTGILRDYIVFSGAHNQRVYLDRDTLEPTDAPVIEQALALSPYTILRVTEDKNGVIWATHPSGIFTIHPDASGYRIDADSLLSIRDQYPVITLIEDEHAWIATESALYHVSQSFKTARKSSPQPFLLSATDGKTTAELYSAANPAPSLGHLPYSQNHLVFRYFAGGYPPLREPVYEFSMQNPSNDWKFQSPDSILTLPSLEEGKYRLTAQLLDGGRKIGQPIVTSFEIAPPWYRSLWAVVSYWAAAIFSIFSIASWAARRAKQKHDFLETLVQERTEELRATMDKLTDEVRNSATLAERNRLAGEIHDSLQQGLSGLALQLDATLRHDKLDHDLHSRLTVARRMVSYTRQEVQQAVWDLESPYLEHDDLDSALHNMAALLGDGSIHFEVETGGAQVELPSHCTHHILRIAQEAIANAVRHSGATRVDVSLHFTADEVRLSISDDGRGFDPNHVFAAGIGHFGLRGLRTRAAKIHGKLQITSQPGQGSQVLLTVPLVAPPQPSPNTEDEPE